MPVERERLARSSLIVAPRLLGAVVTSRVGGVEVAVRLTEVEAYAGPLDPASHAFRRTARSEVMWGPPGRWYVYFIYGMHWCANVITGSEGTASAVLLRAGQVVDGLAAARSRRPPGTPDARLARGPAGLATVLGLTGADTGGELVGPHRTADLRTGPADQPEVLAGPRVGVSVAADEPWRFWAAGDPTVSAYRRGTRAGPPR
jgi:DNA-3-methyladenine glycosylase